MVELQAKITLVVSRLDSDMIKMAVFDVRDSTQR